MDIIIIAIIIVILFSLGSALVGMIRGGEKGSDKMFKSLRLRISLSVFLFSVECGIQGLYWRSLRHG